VEVDRARELVAGDQLAAVRDDFLLGGGGVGFQDDGGVDAFAPLLVGDTEHGAFEHGGVFGDCVLDLD
jgi:hypothetical protein